MKKKIQTQFHKPKYIHSRITYLENCQQQNPAELEYHFPPAKPNKIKEKKKAWASKLNEEIYVEKQNRNDICKKYTNQVLKSVSQLSSTKSPYWELRIVSVRKVKTTENWEKKTTTKK